MNWKEKIEQSPTIWLLGVALAAFTMGFGSYQAILAVAGRETVEAGSYVLEKDLSERCAALSTGITSATVPNRGEEYEELADDFHQLAIEGEALLKGGRETPFLKATSWFDRVDIALNDPKLGPASPNFKPFGLLTMYSGHSIRLNDKDQGELLQIVGTVTEVLRGYEFLMRRIAASQGASVPQSLPKLDDINAP